jgi:hypothetical protein
MGNEMRLALNVTIAACMLSCAHLAGGCAKDKRPARISTEAVISISIDRTEVGLGGLIMLHVQLTNASIHPLTVLETTTQRDFEIHVEDSHGVEPPLTERAKSMRGKGKYPDVIFRSFPLTLEPSEVLKADEDVGQAYLLTEPGRYTVTVCRVVFELGPVLSNSIGLSIVRR